MFLESRSMIGAINFFLKKKCCLSAECVCVHVSLAIYLSIYIHTHTHTHTHIYIYIYIYIYICMLSHFSRVQLFVTAWTI